MPRNTTCARRQRTLGPSRHICTPRLTEHKTDATTEQKNTRKSEKKTKQTVITITEVRYNNYSKLSKTENKAIKTEQERP